MIITMEVNNAKWDVGDITALHELHFPSVTRISTMLFMGLVKWEAYYENVFSVSLKRTD